MSVDYKSQLRAALEKNDIRLAGETAMAAFADPAADEPTLEWIAGTAFEGNLPEASEVVPKFIQRFPNSLGLPRIFMAQVLEQQNPDAATDFARIYLRLASDHQLLGKLTEYKIIRTGVTRAFLILPSAYKALGALSYARRVLEKGMMLAIEDESRPYFQEDLGTLNAQMQNGPLKSMDQEWETFFKTGLNAESVLRRCEDMGFNVMSKRVELLETQFRFQKGFQVGENEMFQIITKSAEGHFAIV